MRWSLIWFLLASIWGSTWLFIKLGLDDLPPFTFAGIRFVIAVIPLVLLLWLRRARVRLHRADWGLIALTGFLMFTIDYGLVFWGEAHISSGLTAILFSTFPIFGLLFAHLLIPAEPLRLQKVLGVLLGVGGVVLIFANQVRLENPLAFLGAVAVVIAAACGAFASVLLKARGSHIDPTVVTVGQMAVGLVPLLAIGAATEGSPLRFHWTPLAVVSILYLALVGSALTFVLWYRMIQVIEVTKAALIPLFSTLIAVFLGWLVRGEVLSWRSLAGGALVLAGLARTATSRSARPVEEHLAG